MRAWPVLVLSVTFLGACTDAPQVAPANVTPPEPAPIDIRPAADQPISERERLEEVALLDLDAIVDRGYVRILVSPSRTYFETVDGRHRGRAVDVGVALAKALGQGRSREVAAVFIATGEDQLIPDLLAGRGDVAANVLLTFARDEQVAFAPPIKTGIRELVVTPAGAPLVSLEDVGGRAIHVRRNSDHHASLARLNEQLVKINRPPAKIVVSTLRTDEDLMAAANSGTVPATIVDDYIFEQWRDEFPRISANRDIAVSQDGSLSWVTRKDAPKLREALKRFFTTHHLTFR